MLNESKATLSDGTTIDELINVQTREVSMRLLSDHEIYKLEMERIFAKTWLLLGHETEIPNAGDFVVRDMGEDQVIVSRDRKGDVHVLLNVCPHRGMRLSNGGKLIDTARWIARHLMKALQLRHAGAVVAVIRQANDALQAGFDRTACGP